MLRSSSAVIVLPIVVVFVLAAIGNDITSWTTAGYWPSATGSSTYALPFISTACAAMGAWEGARLTRGHVFSQVSVRSPLTISASVLVPVVAAGGIASLAALLLAAGSAGVGAGLPDLMILAAELVLLLANTLVGFCIGRRLPALISVPASLVGAFIVNAFPASWSILWLRHLVGGGLSDCCALDQVVNTRAVWCTLLFAGGLAAACLTVINYRHQRLAPAIALGILIAGTGSAVATAQGLQADATSPRPLAVLDCKQGPSATVCLWPEVTHASTVRSETQKAVAKLQAFGVTTPSTFTMAARPTAQEAKLGIGPSASAQDVPPGVVAGLLPQLPACATQGAYPGGEAVAPVAAWLMLTAGASENTLAAKTDPDTSKLARQVASMPKAEQLRWYAINTSAMKTCTVKPQLIPVGGAK
ncbi:DUF7224 domain-containing protein [Streptomyces sp. CB01201]|uniref:DUF7224 domain-containing protein n=1 Tax=Streptomyces sp. CB01201 TaxID=2020324 RepID=UPI00131CB076|nr:hypothetical protein [Streptomyces sp. CB01201]